MSRKRAFTLIELLSVITILGVLAAIIIPTVGKATQKAKKAQAASNLRQIATAYISYTTTSGGSSRTLKADNIYKWAAQLANETGVNDASIWVLSNDPKVETSNKDKPLTIAKPDGTPQNEFKNYPLSFTVATKLRSSAPASTTPVAWTRGLKEDGTWSQDTGVYGAEGGFIAFLDGHVSWYSSLAETPLANYSSGEATQNYKDAMNPEASVLEPQV